MRASEPTVDRPITGEELPDCIADICNCGTLLGAAAKIADENVVKFDFCKMSHICFSLSSLGLLSIYPRTLYYALNVSPVIWYRNLFEMEK